MVQGHVFLRMCVFVCVCVCVCVCDNYSYLLSSRFILFTLRNYFTLCKMVLRIWRKIIFSVTINLRKKVILSCLFVKGFKRLKLIFDRKRRLNWEIHPFDICSNQGRIRAGGIFMRVGGNSLKYLKSGRNRKEGRGHKDFKKWGQAGLRCGCLKKGEDGTPLRTMNN